MSQKPPSETLNNQLLATIERQRRIICNLLIKNEELRTRLMRAKSQPDQPPGQQSTRIPLEAPDTHCSIEPVNGYACSYNTQGDE